MRETPDVDRTRHAFEAEFGDEVLENRLQGDAVQRVVGLLVQGAGMLSHESPAGRLPSNIPAEVRSTPASIGATGDETMPGHDGTRARADARSGRSPSTSLHTLELVVSGPPHAVAARDLDRDRRAGHHQPQPVSSAVQELIQPTQ